MKIKMGIKNIKQNINGYLIYIITLVIAFSLVGAVASLSNSKDILSLAENMSMLRTVSIFAIIISVFIVSYLTGYVTFDLLDKRKKEFGILLLSGMEKRKIAGVFAVELIIMSLLALVFSFPISLFFQKLLTQSLINLFEVKYSISLNLISVHSMASVFIFLIGIQSISVIIIRRKLNCANIHELLLENRTNAEIKINDFKKYKWTFSLAVMYSIAGIVLILKFFKASNNFSYIWAVLSLFMLIIGVFGMSKCGAVIITVYNNRLKIDKNYGVKTIIVRQFSSKVFANSQSIGVVSILMTLSLIILMFGLSFGAFYKSNIKNEAPFDIALYLDYPWIDFTEVVQFINEKENVKNHLQYKLYENETQANLMEFRKKDRYMMLSDYNFLRSELGLQSIHISEGEYIIHAEDWETQVKLGNVISDEIFINGHSLINKEIYSEPFLQNGHNGTFYLIIVNDMYNEYLKPVQTNLVISTYGATDPALKNELREVINSDYFVDIENNSLITKIPMSNTKITFKVSVKSWSEANGLVGVSVFSFMSMFIGVILIITCLTLLSLQQLTQIDKQKNVFKVLDNIGYNNMLRARIIKKQIAFYLTYPLLLPVAILLIVTFLIQYYYGKLAIDFNVFIKSGASTFVIFLSICIVYYYFTYYIQKQSLIRRMKS